MATQDIPHGESATEATIRAARTRLRVRAKAHAVETGRLAAIRRRRRGIATIIGRVGLAIVLLVVAAAGAGLWRLRQGPVSADSITERVSQALEAQFGTGFDVTVEHAQISLDAEGPILGVSGVTVRDSAGNLVVAAPQAEITFDPLGLIGAQLNPRSISFLGLAVILTIAPDGTVSVSANGNDDPASETAAPQLPATAEFGPASVLDALATRSGPLAVLERAGIRDGHLRINDRRRNRSVVYDKLALGFARPEADAVRVNLSARGPQGSWSAQASVSGQPGARRDLRLDVDNLSIAEFLGFAEPGALPATTDMPLRGSISMSLDADNAIASLDGRITGGSAMILFMDPEAEPIFVDSVRGAFGWDTAAHAVTVRSLDFDAGDTHWRLAGQVSAPRAQGDMWTVSLASSDSTMAGDGFKSPPVAIEHVVLQGRVPIGLSAFLIDRFELAGPELSLALTGAIGRTDDMDGLRLGITSGRMPVRNLMAFWPSFVAADVRDHMLINALGGMVERFQLAVSLSSKAIEDAVAKKPLPDESVKLELDVTGGVLIPGPGLPVLNDLSASVQVTGRTVHVVRARSTVGSAGKTLTLSNGRFDVPDAAQKPTPASVEFDLQGTADAAVDLLRTEGLKPFVAVPSDIAAVKGSVSARVKVNFPLEPVLKPTDVVVQLTGQATGVSAENLFGREKLEGGSFTFTQDRSGLLLKGDGKLGGTPAAFEMRQPANSAVSDVVVTTTLDEAGRARRGIKLPGQLTGPLDLKLSVHDAGSAKPAVKVEADFTKAVINDLLPGWNKAAGKPGKATFRLDTDGDVTVIDDLVVDSAGGVQIKGSARVAQDGGLKAARLTSLRLSPSDDIRLDLDRSGSVAKATVKAGMLDARPLLRALMAPGGSTLGNPGDVDIDLSAKTILGDNNEKLSATDLKLSLRNGEIRDFRLAGRFAQSPVSGQPARGEGGQAGIVIESGDAGTFLRFFDIYRKMLGGTLIVQLFGSPPAMDGALIADNFILANEPALGRAAGGEPGKPANVAFTKLKAGFGIGGGRLDIRDGTMWGPSVGGTLEGAMDFARDRLDLTGTFVPAYGLNNALNRVPIVGTILGGGQNEGIFAVNFRISGKLSQPTLSINPLSAVAPGVLRKFFGVLGPSAVGDPPPRPAPLDAPTVQR